MSYETLVQQKSELLLDLETAKHEGKNRRTIVNLASRAAALESQVATLLLEAGRGEDAVVNLISEASCLSDARRDVEARRVLSRALTITGRSRTREYLQAELGRYEAINVARVFREAAVNIENNDQLRRPQREAYVESRRHFAQHRDHAIIQLPVGCGKTGVMAILPFGIAEGRVLVIAPNLEIRKNLFRKLDYTDTDSFLKKYRVLGNGHYPTCSLLNTKAALTDSDVSDIVVTNIQQLVASGFRKWLQKFPDDYFDLILVDEGHHGAAASWQAVFEAFSRAKVTSFTATPIRADGRRVEGKRIYHFPIAQAIREGYVKDIANWRLDLDEIEFVHKGEKHIHSREDILSLREESWFRRGVALSTKCNEHIVDASIQAMRQLRGVGEVKHQIIAAACQIDHAKSIASLYRARKVNADVIHSKLDEDAQEQVRTRLESGELDAIVHVGMLGEGADYPRLGVAAIFRPYSHVMPYVQFIGRVMRVNVQNSAGHPDNRGYVVTHPGLHVDRWWKELKELDADDEAFLRAVAEGESQFAFDEQAPSGEGRRRRRYRPAMEVLAEVVEHFVEERFLPEQEALRLDDLIDAIQLRGYSLDDLGLTRADLERRLAETIAAEAPKRERLVRQDVQPQRARQEAQRRLDERAKSAGAELLVELGLSAAGRDLSRIRSNLPHAIILVNQRLKETMGWGRGERDLASQAELASAYDMIDDVVDELAAEIRERRR